MGKNQIARIGVSGLLFAVSLAGFSSTQNPAPSESSESIDFHLHGVDSPYSQKLKELTEKWLKGEEVFCTAKDPVEFPQKPHEFQLNPHFTENDRLYIGFSGRMWVEAPENRVIWAVLDPASAPIVHFKYDEVKSKKTEAGLNELYRVKYISLFKFKSAHTVVYETQQQGKKAAILWQLKEKDSVVGSDGVFLLNEEEPGKTRFCQLSYYTAKFGPAALLKKEIWKESYLGALIEGYSIQVRAENPKLGKSEHEKKVKGLVPGEISYSDDIAPRVKPNPLKIEG